MTGRDLWLVEELAQQMTLGALSITNYQFSKLPKDSIKNPYKTDKWSVAGREFWLVEDLAQQILNIHRQNFQKIPSTRLYQWLISGWQRMLMRLDGVAHLHNSSILRNQHQNKNPDESEQWASMKRLVNYPTPFSVTIIQSSVIDFPQRSSREVFQMSSSDTIFRHDRKFRIKLLAGWVSEF